VSLAKPWNLCLIRAYEGVIRDRHVAGWGAGGVGDGVAHQKQTLGGVASPVLL